MGFDDRIVFRAVGCFFEIVVYFLSKKRWGTGRSLLIIGASELTVFLVLFFAGFYIYINIDIDCFDEECRKACIEKYGEERYKANPGIWEC